MGSFQVTRSHPQLNVYDNMAFPLRSPKFRLPEEQGSRSG